MGSGPNAQRDWVEPKDDLLDWLDDDLRVDSKCPYVRRGARDEMAGKTPSHNPYYRPEMTVEERMGNVREGQAWFAGWAASGHWFGRFNKDAYEQRRATVTAHIRTTAIDQLAQQREFVRLLGLDHKDPQIRREFLDRFFRPK